MYCLDASSDRLSVLLLLFPHVWIPIVFFGCVEIVGLYSALGHCNHYYSVYFVQLHLYIYAHSTPYDPYFCLSPFLQ